MLGEGLGDRTWSRSVDSPSLGGERGVGAVWVCAFPANALARGGSVRERLVELDRQVPHCSS